MSDHTVCGLRAAIKSLREVVAPAVDPSNPLAVEQLRMVCGYLALAAERLPQRGERVAYELRSAAALAAALVPLAGRCEPDAAAALAAARVAAGNTTARPDATEADRQRATDALNAAISALVRSAATADAATRGAIERAVVANARPWLDVQRAWFAPLGFDPDPGELPTLAAALAESPSTPTS